MATGELASEIIHISREELREVLREERKESSQEVTDAVRRALSEVGLYADDAEERKQIRKDFSHLRRWREATDMVARQVGMVVIALVVAGFLGAFWLGVKFNLVKPL